MPSSASRRWTALWVLCFLAATAMAAQTPTDDGETTDEADTDEAAGPPPELEVVEQSPTVAAGESFVVRLRVAGLDLSELTVGVDVFPAADNAEPLLVPGERDPLVSSDDDNTAAEVLLSSTDLLTVRIPVGAEAADGELTLPEPGVYPIRLSLTDGEGARATVETTLLYRALPVAGSPEAEIGPLPVGLVIDIGDGALSLEAATGLLAEHRELPATIVVHPDVVDHLADDDNEAEREAFVQALAARPVVLGTHVPLDPSALVAAGQADAYRLAWRQLVARADELQLRVDRTAVLLEAPLTADGAALLVEMGITSAVGHRLGTGDPWPLATGPADAPDMAPLDLVGVDRGRITTAATDDELTPVAEAHGLLARLVLEGTGPAVVGELARAQDPGLVLEVLTAPETAPVIDLVPATDPTLLADDTLAVPLVTTPRQNLVVRAEQLARIDALLVEYEAFHADGPRSPDHFRSVLMEGFRVDVSPATRNDTLGRVEVELSGAFEEITLPGNQSVTLAAQSAPLPVAVENGADGARFVRVRLVSDRITLAEPDLVLRVEPGVSAIDVPVRAGSLGASPVTMSLISPEGDRVLSTTRFQVRSTAVPGLGLLISAIGLGGLGAWWWASSRRNSGGDDDDGGGGDDDPGPTVDDGPPGTARRPIDLRPPADEGGRRPVLSGIG
ncbi:MAG: DUF6049 family protein [Actinomycetota bacterium]